MSKNVVAVLGLGEQGICILAELASASKDDEIIFKGWTKSCEGKNPVDEAWEEIEYLVQGINNRELEKLRRRIQISTNLVEIVSGATIVFEALPDEFIVKVEVLGNVEAIVDETCVFATNTLTLFTSKLAEYLVHGDRLIGVRFLDPVYLIPHVELTYPQGTRADVLQVVLDFLASQNKVAYLFDETEYQMESPGSRESDKMGLERGRLELGRVHATAQYEAGFRFNGRPRPSRSPNVVYSGTECCVCLTSPPTVVNATCNHTAMCQDCSKEKVWLCPICRAPMTIFRHDQRVEF